MPDLGPPPPAPAPLGGSDRHLALDAVRGLAVLGILLMNLTAWGLHIAAYDDPSVAGGASGANLASWLFNHLLVDGKMRALFSMLFGASALLLVSRIEAAGAAAADLYYRRLLWLMLFGIAHAYLLWAGDILYVYALCGLILYPFRVLRPRALLAVAAAFALLSTGANVGRWYELQELQREATEAAALAARGAPLDDEQREALRDWEEQRRFFAPSAEQLAKDRAAWGGDFASVFAVRAAAVAGFLHSMPFYGPFNWDVWAMMFLGMALLKLGVLTGERSHGFYLKLAAAGYGLGLAANSASAFGLIAIEWDPLRRAPYAATYELGRIAIALAHAAIVILLCRRGALPALTGSLAAVGRMAFSNYVLQSLVCSTLFYGYGFGLYGELERYELLYVFAAVTAVQLAFSRWWLAHYRFGPLEWAWRSLTYWRRQPLRRAITRFPARPDSAGAGDPRAP